MATNGETALVVCLAIAVAAGCGGSDRRTSDGGAVDAGPSDAGATDDGSVTCTRDTDCADAVDCTTDTCTTTTGACRHVLTPAICGVGESCDPATGCEGGRACATDIDCADTDACTTSERCDPAARVCTYRTLDGDEDGDPPRVCGGTDCDDSRATVYAGAVELCDGLDNDCDRAIDEGATESCGARELCASGSCECVPGVMRCGGACIDVTNDPRNCGACGSSCGEGGTSCLAGICLCAGGLTSCVEADWPGGSYCTDLRSDAANCGGCGIVTVGAPHAETCDGVDDDCDGLVDDGNPGGGAACTSGLGSCARTGTIRCRSAELVCDVAPGSPVTETCNGADDDCNGVVDDLAPLSCGVGACTVTAPACVGATPGTCTPAIPSLDICNGIDDDCNGTVDDGCAIVEIAVGLYQTCVRRISGVVLCWGSGKDGALGDGGISTRLDPMPVLSLTDAVELSSGGLWSADGGMSHTCARVASGSVVCWGNNDVGQLGDGSRTNGLSPTAVYGLLDSVEVAAGNYHTCARRASGVVVCWGSNEFGQLGDATTIQRLTPTAVSGLTDAVEIAAGKSHTCARRTSGEVVCWGSNFYGQLGTGTTADETTPRAVVGLFDAVEISAGDWVTCARRAAGSVMCWGIGVGDGTAESRFIPTEVSTLSDVVELATGAAHTCARRSSGEVNCWGINDYGHLGIGVTGGYWTVPQTVSFLTDAVEVSAGEGHTCARRRTGEVVCWGWNGSGQLGDRTTTLRNLPVRVLGL